MAIHIDVVVGAIEAFLTASVVVGFDCQNNVNSTLRVGTIAVYRVKVAYFVWSLCGAAAALAFLLSASDTSESWVNQALSLGAQNNYARGFAVGASVLVLIRSKVLTAGGSDIGGEYFYNLGRIAILRAVTRKRALEREDFLRAGAATMLEIADFENKLIGFVNTLMIGEPETDRKSLADQLRQIQSGKPQGAFDAASPDWQRYYRNLAGVAVDYCGAADIAGWVKKSP